MNNSTNSNGFLITKFFCRHETSQNSSPDQTKEISECCTEDASEQTRKQPSGRCVANGDVVSSSVEEEDNIAEPGRLLKDGHTNGTENESDPSNDAVTMITSTTSFGNPAKPGVAMTQSVLSLDGKGQWVVSSACDSSSEGQGATPSMEIAASDNESGGGGPQNSSHLPLEDSQSEDHCTTANLSRRKRKHVPNKKRSGSNSRPRLCSDCSSQPTKDAVATTVLNSTTREGGPTPQPKRRNNSRRRRLVATDQDKNSVQNTAAEEHPTEDLSHSPVITFKSGRERRKSSMIVYSSSDQEDKAVYSSADEEDKANCMVVASGGKPRKFSHSPLEDSQGKDHCTTANLSQRKNVSKKKRSGSNSKPRLCSDCSSQPTNDAVVTAVLNSTTRESGSSSQLKRRSSSRRSKLVAADQDKNSSQKTASEEDPTEDFSHSPVIKRGRERRKSSMITYSSSDEEDEADCMVVGGSSRPVSSMESRLETDRDLSCDADEATSTVISSSVGMRKESLSTPSNQSSSAPGPLADSWAAIFRQPCATSSKGLQISGRKRHRRSPSASPKKAASPSKHHPHHHSPQRCSPLKRSPLLRKLQMASHASLKEHEQDPPSVKKQLSFSLSRHFDCAPYSELLHATQSCHADIQSLFRTDYPHLRVKPVSSATLPMLSPLRLGNVTMATEAVPADDGVVEVRVNC